VVADALYSSNAWLQMTLPIIFSGATIDLYTPGSESLFFRTRLVMSPIPYQKERKKSTQLTPPLR